ncbi:MAG: hypothetical protein OES69_12765 [Myxococcales bacterium]|nr:hypothetical protein [Myxococcales bacterium]MDH3844807.1 hypothetical protein [Myxococcales bacterium]
MFTRMGPSVGVCLGLLLAGSEFGYAVAQRGEATVDVVKVESVNARAEPTTLSPKQQAQAADAAVEEATASCAAQAQALQSAKSEKDIIRATCVDDKLAQCNANLQNLKRRQAALKESIEANDAGSRNHEFAVIGVLSQKFKMLQQAANQCVGQDLFDTGDTKVTQEVDLFAPDADPAVVAPVPEPPIPYIPPPVSGVS